MWWVTIVEISGDVDGLPERALGAPVLTISGDEAPYFSRIGEVEWLADGRFVVEDNQHRALYVFASDGSYVRALGQQGDGPGEFQNITETTLLPGDSVFVYDRIQIGRAHV